MELKSSGKELEQRRFLTKNPAGKPPPPSVDNEAVTF